MKKKHRNLFYFEVSTIYVYYLVDDKDPFLPLPPSQSFLTIVESWPD